MDNIAAGSHSNRNIIMHNKVAENDGNSVNNEERGSVLTISKLWSVQEHNATLEGN